MTPQRLGIFGGTFDPPHVGHQILAAESADQLALDQILWVLTPDPPHKQDRIISPADIRLEMVEAVVSDDMRFEISRVEIDREGPHFALDTIRLLRKKYPSSRLIYLIGGDSLHDLPIWYKPADFIEICDEIGVMCRPGQESDLEELETVIPGIIEKVRFINAPLLEISSSQIRKRAGEGRAFRYYVPAAVYKLIMDRGIYNQDP